MATMLVWEKGLPVARAMNRLRGTMPRTTRRIAEAEDDVPLPEHLASPSMPAGHLRVRREWREMPGRAEHGMRPAPRSCQTRWAVSSSRLLPPHPVRKSPARSSSRRNRARIVSGCVSGSLGQGIQFRPQVFSCPGKTSVHGNGSELGDCKGVKPVRGPLVVPGKDQDSTHDRWTVSEQPAEENPLELERHRK